MFCPKCGNQVHDEAVVCIHCGCSIGNSNSSSGVKDEVSVGLCILSFLIPLFGIIYWPVMHSKTPKRAKACGVTALVTWIVSFVLTLAMSGM